MSATLFYALLFKVFLARTARISHDVWLAYRYSAPGRYGLHTRWGLPHLSAGLHISPGSQFLYGFHPDFGSHIKDGLHSLPGSHFVMGVHLFMGSHFVAGFQAYYGLLLRGGLQASWGSHFAQGFQGFKGLHPVCCCALICLLSLSFAFGFYSPRLGSCSPSYCILVSWVLHMSGGHYSGC